MIKDGTSLVEVTAINFGEPDGDRPVRRAAPAAPPSADREQAPSHGKPPLTRIFVQVGAFGDRSNAERRLGALSLAGIRKAFIHEERNPGRTLYRVRIGPVADVVQYDVLVEELEGIGIVDPYLITE